MVLLVGALELARGALDAVIERVGACSSSYRNVRSALARLRSGGAPPLCVLVDASEDVHALVEGIRDEASLFAVPVVALVSRPSRGEYGEAYQSGADDALLLGDSGGLTRRLANLCAGRSNVRPAATLGAALVASADAQARRRLGRTLRQAGFEVDYADALADVATKMKGGAAPAFVVTTEPPSERPAHDPKQRNVSNVQGVPVLHISLTSFSSPTRAGDEIADVSSRLLFFADERAKAQFKDRRSSTRKLYAGVCTFREAGSPEPNYGVTHNVSRDGLYVRTLDPPKTGSAVWIELDAPLADQAIHLRAKVCWQRLPGAGPGILQPGFGVQLDAAACPSRDLQAFLRGYEALSE
jgi:hypothetical protein